MKFRKKPVVIDAVQWFKHGDHPGVRQISDSDDMYFTGMGGATLINRDSYGVIGTLESPNHLVSPGDYIITGIQGELYPCKPDIFHATYESIEELSTHEQKKAIFKDYKRWTVGVTDDKRVYIQDDDFSYDARLYINGNFSDLDEQIMYANSVADSLNEIDS